MFDGRGEQVIIFFKWSIYWQGIDFPETFMWNSKQLYLAHKHVKQ